MGRPNYSFAKRQREIAKKKKKEEKRLKKAEADNDGPKDELVLTQIDEFGNPIIEEVEEDSDDDSDDDDDDDTGKPEVGTL